MNITKNLLSLKKLCIMAAGFR